MSDALKSNTALVELDLFGKDKRNNTQIASINNPFFFHYHKTGNKIGGTGATSMSDALKGNAALTKLNLRSEHKRNNT